MDKSKIGFLSLQETETPDSYVGAFLITNENGIPLEFKCTNSVKPTAIQRSLYGEGLKSHIAITLCGIPLLNSINNKPNLIFINIPIIMKIRPYIEIPTLLIKRAGEIIDVQSDDKLETDRQRFENMTGQFQPIVIQSHPDFKEESKSFSDTINQLFTNFDLIEPFDRMKKSVEILGKNDSKFK